MRHCRIVFAGMRRWVKLASFAELVWARENLESEVGIIRNASVQASIAAKINIVTHELTHRGWQEQELLAGYEPRTA